MNQLLIVGNWKMHKTVAETKEHIKRLKPLVFRSAAGVWLAVPYTDIVASAELTGHTEIQIGAQNMSDLLGGSLTGEISAPMIIEAGAKFVILGHSERRRFFGESDAMINRKVKLAFRSGLQVILCIGETLDERKADQTFSVLQTQLEKCLEGVSHEHASQLVVAYEPVWAIGSKQSASQENVEEIHVLCKNFIASTNGLSQDRIRVLYGGSVTPSNAKDYLQKPNIDGLLVGSASLDVQSFAEIIHQADEMMQ